MTRFSALAAEIRELGVEAGRHEWRRGLAVREGRMDMLLFLHFLQKETHLGQN